MSLSMKTALKIAKLVSLSVVAGVILVSALGYWLHAWKYRFLLEPDTTYLKCGRELIRSGIQVFLFRSKLWELAGLQPDRSREAESESSNVFANLFDREAKTREGMFFLFNDYTFPLEFSSAQAILGKPISKDKDGKLQPNDSFDLYRLRYEDDSRGRYGLYVGQISRERGRGVSIDNIVVAECRYDSDQNENDIIKPVAFPQGGVHLGCRATDHDQRQRGQVHTNHWMGGSAALA